MSEEAGPQSPVVAGGGGFKIQRPEIYHPGWLDLNKNGLKDAYEDPAQPVGARVEDLLKRMTREERLGQLGQQQMKPGTDEADAALVAAGGIGSFLGAAPDAGLRNRLQRLAVEESRLGIPLIFGFDTIHGFRTIFPIPLGLSCAWDEQLIERVETVAAAESAAAGHDGRLGTGLLAHGESRKRACGKQSDDQFFHRCLRAMFYFTSIMRPKQVPHGRASHADRKCLLE
jgi:hypothetical protein